MEDKYYLTKEKLDELKKEYEYLIGTKREEIAIDLEKAKSLGDLKENAEYHEARANQAVIEERIAKLNSILKSAIIITRKKVGIVGIDSIVVVKKDKDPKEKEFHIVGSEETNLGNSRISHKSPLGSALIGKKKGDKIKCCTPGGSVEYTILDLK
ncbi:transcription elongation factor GreA [Patescibacteria group bacterium]|nr:transcription elongation factor GreA [Patescibacteria group bacterium]MBU4115640.1 transcription elongation factor GreA [Patescibacteria group bacterium]